MSMRRSAQRQEGRRPSLRSIAWQAASRPRGERLVETRTAPFRKG
jgi:hypothetical protein